MDITKALLGAKKSSGWSVTRMAATAGVTEAAARKWLVGAAPGGQYLLRLMAEMPGLRERLGYTADQDDASVPYTNKSNHLVNFKG